MTGKTLKQRRVAIVHEWLPVYGGAERVLEQMIQVFPDADIYSLIDNVPAEQRGFLHGKPVHTSVIQKLPFGRRGYRHYLPIMPFVIEQFDLSEYDIIISSSYAVAKGVITGPDQLHISYIHSPVRFAWDLQHQYLRESKLTTGLKSLVVRWTLHHLRLWDVRTAAGVDHMLANSHFIQRRIQKVYRRDSEVIYPPVDTSGFSLHEDKEPFYLTASRMVPYKKIDLIVEAFSAMPDKQLVVIGDGPDFAKIRAKAGPNVRLMGYQPFDVLRDHMQRAQAFVFAAQEDFGIVPLEAQACGTPVIAFGRGGALETVRGLHQAQPTGVFFESQTVAAIVAAVRTFEGERERFQPKRIREHAQSLDRRAPQEFSRLRRPRLARLR
jgi:glycosyltransferase involved in cell wall biosynthesis